MAGTAHRCPAPPSPRRSPHEGKPRLRILLAADTFWPEINGAASFVSRLAAGLVERGHDVHIAAPSFSNKLQGAQIEEVKLITKVLFLKVRITSPISTNNVMPFFLEPFCDMRPDETAATSDANLCNANNVN